MDERRREREGLGGLLDELVRETVLPGSPGHFEFGSAARRLSLPEAHAGANAWLVAARAGESWGDFERLILQQTVTVVALASKALRPRLTNTR